MSNDCTHLHNVHHNNFNTNKSYDFGSATGTGSCGAVIATFEAVLDNMETFALAAFSSTTDCRRRAIADRGSRVLRGEQWHSRRSASACTCTSTSQHIYRVCLKKWPKLFCQNFVKSPSNLIIFGTQIAKTIEICKVHSLSTSRRFISMHNHVKCRCSKLLHNAQLLSP